MYFAKSKDIFGRAGAQLRRERECFLKTGCSLDFNSTKDVFS